MNYNPTLEEIRWLRMKKLKTKDDYDRLKDLYEVRDAMSLNPLDKKKGA